MPITTYPTSPRSAFLQWCTAHKHVFSAHAGEIGLSVAQANAFAAAALLSETRLLAQKQAQEAARVATQQAQDALAELNRQAANVVRNVRAFAESSDDPNAVYAVAQIAPRSQPAPAPPPGKPRNLSVTLDATLGSVTLKWKADNPASTSGTTYLIRRRLPGERGFTILGLCGKKSFVDRTLIAGPPSVEYVVQGQRGDVSGPVSSIFTVNFGKLADGRRTASVSAAPASVSTAAVNAGMMSGSEGITSGGIEMMPGGGRIMPRATAMAP